MLLLLVVSMTLTTTGIPLPVPPSSKGKDRSIPFPCMDRPCGCMNAEQCERECCCFSKQEKETWAVTRSDSDIIKADDASTCPLCKNAGDEPTATTWVFSLSALKCHRCEALGLLAETPALFAVVRDLPILAPEPGESLSEKDSLTPYLFTSPLDRPPRHS